MKCRFCEGTGKVEEEYYNVDDPDDEMNGELETVECNDCDGTGEEKS